MDIKGTAVKKLRDHSVGLAQQTMTLIIAELSEDIEKRGLVEERAARRLRDASTALGEPEKRLAAAKQEVSTCEDRVANCRANTKSEDLDTRVDSEILLDKYIGQLPALQEKTAQIEAELQALYRDRNKAKDQLETEQRYIELHKQAMTQPFTHPLAQQTKAYAAYRLPTVLIDVISTGSRDHPEWDVCHRMIGELLYISGIRDKDYQLPDTGVIDISAYMPNDAAVPQPNAQEVMRQDRLALDTMTALPTVSPEYTQDRPPANVMHRPEMIPPEVPSEHLRIR